MGGSLEGNGQGVHEVSNPPGVEAVVEDGIWKVMPRNRVLEDFMPVASKRTSHGHKKEPKRSKFCEGYRAGTIYIYKYKKFSHISDLRRC